MGPDQTDLGDGVDLHSIHHAGQPRVPALTTVLNTPGKKPISIREIGLISNSENPGKQALGNWQSSSLQSFPSLPSRPRNLSVQDSSRARAVGLEHPWSDSESKIYNSVVRTRNRDSKNVRLRMGLGLAKFFIGKLHIFP